MLPVELILQVGRGAGFAMVFALLTAAILWNLGTWYFGLPSSSTHTMVGSIIGVGIANQLLAAKSGTSGVDWAQALNVGKTLLLSPVIGFVIAALLLMIAKVVIPDPRLYEAPTGSQPPPFWIRCLLIGTVPTAYTLNHAIPASHVQTFIAVSDKASALCKVTTIGKSHRKFPKFISVSFPDGNGPHPVGLPCRSGRSLAKVPDSDACYSIG